MKSFVAVLFALATVSAAAAELELRASDLAAAGISIAALTIEVAPKSCASPEFDQNDTNEDGVLDQVCYGLKYDPCSGEGPDYHGHYAAGRVCVEGPSSPVLCTPAGELTTGAPAC